MDALWDMADLIIGEGEEFTPTEGFVFGMAALIHDLAMTMSAYPSDLSSLIGVEQWNDAVFVHIRNIFDRPPTPEELSSPPAEAVADAQRELLRELHAEQAARLPHQRFSEKEGETEYYLISDPDLRNMYGELIGRIAASHWWDIGEVADQLGTVMGAPGIFPREWIVDPLKLACLLRASDASHIDSRRAPGFLRALKNLNSESRAHWIFQERIQRPRLNNDRLVYTAAQPFTSENSTAWWICIDTLRMIDHELRSIDVVLADADRTRFNVRSVAHVDDLKRMAQLIPVSGWFPIEANVKVGDVVSVIEKLGGEALYGQHPYAALREIISNGADAVRARKILESRDGSTELRLRVQVGTRTEAGHTWLTVRDNGIGMSRETMSGPLLDFGTSYWTSAAARRSLPGLISSGFAPTGKFGIGFFSIFMLGNVVKVTSRRFDLEAADTHVLLFEHGLGSRPLLRRANRAESLKYGGTEISVRVDNGRMRRILDKYNGDLSALCVWLCPALDVDLDVVSQQGEITTVARANDWQTCKNSELLNRVVDNREEIDHRLHELIRPISDGEKWFGRAAIWPRDLFNENALRAVITSGGVRADRSAAGIVGILLGEALRAARDIAFPTVPINVIAKWATEQARIASTMSFSVVEQLELSSLILALGGDPAELKVAETGNGTLCKTELLEWARNKTRVRLIHDATLHLLIGEDKSFADRMDDDVIAVGMGRPGIFSTGPHEAPSMSWPKYNDGSNNEDFCQTIIAAAWGVSEREILDQTRAQRKVSAQLSSEQDIIYGRLELGNAQGPLAQEIGRWSSGEPVNERVYTINRPNAKSAAEGD